MGDHCVRLADKKASSGCIGRPRTKATTLAMNSGLPRIKLRREAPEGDDALDDHFRDAVVQKPLAVLCQPSATVLRKASLLASNFVQRQRFDAFRIFAAKP